MKRQSLLPSGLRALVAWGRRIVTRNQSRLSLLDPAGGTFMDVSKRAPVPVRRFRGDACTAVILAIGQSNISNEGAKNAKYTPDRGVFNFNFLDGKCYVARDPLLGATGDRSNFITRLGDKLVKRGLYQNVVLVPIANGGTFVAQWAPGGNMNIRLTTTLDRLRKAGLAISHIIWQHGEGDASVAPPNPVSYRECFLSMVDQIRKRGERAPIFVSQSTIAFGGPSETIREAQRNLPDPAFGIFLGADTDVIEADGRFDGCHFNSTGLERTAELWFEVLSNARVK